jgi:hypothetical protein
MTAVVKEVYDALKKAGVPEKEAWDAAAALSTHETRFADLKADLDGFRRDVDRRFDAVDIRFDAVERRLDRLEHEVGALQGEVTEIKTELRMHRWAFGIIAAMQIAILIRLLA